MTRCQKFKMASWYGNALCVTDHLWGESTSYWWIPLTKDQWHGTLMFSLMSVWTNHWTNSPVASDLRHHMTFIWCHSVRFCRNLAWASPNLLLNYLYPKGKSSQQFVFSYHSSDLLIPKCTKPLWVLVTVMFWNIFGAKPLPKPFERYEY